MATRIHHVVARYSLSRLAICYVSVATFLAPRAECSRALTSNLLQELAA